MIGRTNDAGKAHLDLKLIQKLGRQAARPDITLVQIGPLVRASVPATGNPLERVTLALNTGNHLFNRATGHELGQGKVDHHDPDQGRDDQQQPPEDIGTHNAWPAFLL